MRFILITLISWCAATFGVLADDGWSCSNNEMEINCSGEECDISVDGAFTPTYLDVAPGNISFCAYSGCWKGVPYITLTEKSFYAVGPDLRWIHANGADIATVQIAIDTTNGRGVVIGGGFAMPVKCELWECGEDCKSSNTGN